MIQSAVPQKLYELALVLIAHQPSDKLTHVDTFTVADVDLLQTRQRAVDERGRGKKKSEGRHENRDVVSSRVHSSSRFSSSSRPPCRDTVPYLCKDLLQFSVFELPAVLVEKLLQLILGDPAIIVDVDAAGRTAQEGKTEGERDEERRGGR